MEEEGKTSHKVAHVLVVPYPGQGHINPMVQFSKRLASRQVKSTLVTTVFISKSIPSRYGPLIQVRAISDGYDEGGSSQADLTAVYLASLRANGSRTLTELIEQLREEGDPVSAVIYDGFVPWALDVGKQFGLLGVMFFTQSCVVNSIYYHVQSGLIQLPLSDPGPRTISVPGVPELQLWEAPSFVHESGLHPHWLDVVLGQFSNIDQADWVLCNIFYDMEKELVDWMANIWRLRTVGPTLPSYYLDKRLEDDRDYSLSLLFKPDRTLCKSWLDTKPPGSVIYVAFGSYAELPEEQYNELAMGLKGSNHSFLWVVRESEQSKLPTGFIQETSESGLVVGWASQLEILAHKATGCFVSHCGFNSVLEALCLGVPIVAIPQWSDQGTNAKFVEDVWGVGVRAKGDEEVVRRDKVEECVREVMEGKRGEEIRKNVRKWKKLAKEAVDEGGSSDRNIQEFVASLVH